jgi:cytochrome c-type biogenesis protein CcsB
MRKFLWAPLAILAVSCSRKESGSAGFDFGPVSEIVSLDQGRHKPLDTTFREWMHELSGNEGFWRFKATDADSFKELRDGKGKYIQVFPGRNPAENVLRLIAQWDVYKSRPWIRVQFPEVREKFGGDRNREYFSPEELAKRGAEIQKELEEARKLEQKEIGPYHRAVRQLAHQIEMAWTVRDEARLLLIPAPYDEQDKKQKWPSMLYLEGYVEKGEAIQREELRAQEKSLMEAFDRIGRDKLRKAHDQWHALKKALAENKPEDFNRISAEFRDHLRSLNPAASLAPEKVETEIFYNRLRPFSVACTFGYMPAVLLFLLSFGFASKSLRGLAILAHLAGIVLHVYGYALRWQIAARYPLANMYESMIAMGLALAIVGIVLEFFMKSRVFGICAAAIAMLCVVLAENIPIFSPYVSQQQPALLNEVLMTIHVPTIMSAYGCGLLCTGVGIAYIMVYLFAPNRTETLEHLDLCLYRILQITVLLLIGGISLGAVWAGEAWGRWWGWDMKEVWALITLLWYLAMLHSRFTGWVKGLLLANLSLLGFMIIMLTYVGVNILFGAGLHSYGFVLGATWIPLLVTFGLLGGLMILSGGVWLGRRNGKARDAQEIAR